VIGNLGIASVAIPPLGCGLGGLEWDDVHPLIASTLAGLDNVGIVVFPPATAPGPTT
jgi:O-acetyl-ADP-ribose deacetylase (regulator of RNase III)